MKKSDIRELSLFDTGIIGGELFYVGITEGSEVLVSNITCL